MNHTTAAAERGTLRWGPYAAAVVLTGATLAFRLAISPWVGDRPLLILFFIPIVISAYWGGLVPGMFATALTCLAVDYFVFPPAGNFGFSHPLDFAQWLFLLLEGVLISVLFAQFTRARRAELYQALEVRRAATERKVLLGFAVAVAFLGTIGVVSYLSVVRLHENSLLVTRSHAVMTNIDQLVATTWEAESAQRAYVLTGEEPFAAEYTRATGRIDGLVQQLRDAVSGDAAQLARVEPLLEALHGRLRQSAEIVELRRSGGLEAVQRRLTQSAAAPGARLQARVRTLAREMKSAEIRQLNAREAGAERSAQLAQAVIVGGSALALLCVGMALLAIRRDFAGRERAESEIDSFFSLSFDCLTIAQRGRLLPAREPGGHRLAGLERGRIHQPSLAGIRASRRPRANQRRPWKSRRSRRARAELRKSLPAQGRQLARDVMALHARRRPDVRHRARRHRRACAPARNCAKPRSSSRPGSPNARASSARRRTRCARASAASARSSKTAATASRSSTRTARMLYVSPAVTNGRGLPARGIARPLGTERTIRTTCRCLAQARRQVLANPGKPDPFDLAPAPQGWPLDLARRRRHQPARRPVGGRHRH